MNISFMYQRLEIKFFAILVLISLTPLFCFEALEKDAVPPEYPPAFAFVGVNVIPMDRDRILKEQTVVIQNDRIVEIGDKKKVKVPDHAFSMNAHDLYLLPGLSDMHVHLHNLSDAMLWLVNGVTTVRNMRGTPLHLSWREKIAAGEMLGPSLYTCGPILDGSPPAGENVSVITSPEEAEESIQQQKEAGYDCIKVYTRLSRENYEAIITAAKKYGMPVAGHVPSAVGLNAVLTAHQNSIEHLTGYMQELRSEDRSVQMDRIARLVSLTRSAGTWNCVTLIVQRKLAESNEFQILSKSDLMKYVPPLRMKLWHPERNARLNAMKEEEFSDARRGIEVLSRLTKALQQGGAKLLLGTDAPGYFVIPGFSTHEELLNLVAAGLRPYEALETATRNPAEFLGALQEFGTIEEGKRADLILLKGNPLENISYTRHIAGVMTRGHWIPEARIQTILQDVVDSYTIHSNRFDDLPPLVEQHDFSRRYEITSAGLPVGEERFIVKRDPSGSTHIVIQQVTDPPLRALYQLQWDRTSAKETISLESRRPEGSGKASVEIQKDLLILRSDLPAQRELSELRANLVQGSVFQSSCIAFKILLAEKLAALRENETIQFPVKVLDFGVFFNKSFEFRNTFWKVKRMPNRKWELNHNMIPLKSFNFEVTWNHQSAKGMFSVDQDGLPVEFYFQNQGFRRVE